MAQDRVEAVERALTVLEVFDSSQEAFALAELAEATGFYKSTLLRLLGSLARFDYVQRGDIAGAVAFCRQHGTPASRIVQRGLERLGRPIGEIKEAVQEAGRRETFDLEKRMDLLASMNIRTCRPYHPSGLRGLRVYQVSGRSV